MRMFRFREFYPEVKMNNGDEFKLDPIKVPVPEYTIESEQIDNGVIEVKKIIKETKWFKVEGGSVMVNAANISSIDLKPYESKAK